MAKAHEAPRDQSSKDVPDSLPVEVAESAADLGKKLEAVLSVTDAKELKALLQQLGQQIVDSAEGKSGAKMPAMRSLQRLLSKKVKHNGKIMTIGDMLVEDAEALVTLSFPKHKNFIGEQVSAAYFGLMQEMAERGVAARKKQAFSREFRHDPRQFPKTKPIIGPEPKLTRSGVVAWWNTITWITQGISAPTLAAWVNSYMSGSKTIPLGGQLLVLAATMVAATVAMGRGMDWFGNYMRREGTVIKGVMAAFKERPALALTLTLLAAADAYTTNRGLVYIKAIHPDKVAAVKAFEEQTRKDIMPGIIADTNTRINAAVHTAVEETKRHEDAGRTKSGHSGRGDAYKEAERRGNALPASMERVNNEFGQKLQGLLDEYSSTAQRIAEHSYGLDEGQTERIIALVFDNLYRGRVAQITDEWIVAITEAYDREFASPVGAEQIRVGRSLGTLAESNVATPKLSGIEPDMKRLTSDIKLTPVSMDDAQRKLVERYGEDGAMRVKAMLFILAMLMEIGVVFLAHTNWEKLAFQMRKWIKYGVLASKGATSSKEDKEQIEEEMEEVKQREYVPSIKVKRPTHARWHQGAIRQAELDTANLPKYQEILENDSQNLCAMLAELYGPLSEIFHECWPEFPIITAELVEEKLGTLLQRRFNRPARKARALLLGNPARDNAMHEFRKADRDYKHTIGFTLPQRLEAALGMTPSGWSELMDELIPPRWRGIFQKAIAGSLPLQSSVRREWIDRLVKKSKKAKRPRLSTTTKVLAGMTPEDRLVAVENIMQTIEREQGFPQEDLEILRSLMFREFRVGDEEDLYEAPIPETDPEEVEEDEFVEDEELVQPVHPERMSTHDRAENFRAGYENLKDRIKEGASNVGRGLRDGLKRAAGVTVDAARTVATPIERPKAHGGVDDQREKVNLSPEVVEAIRAIAGWKPEGVNADNAAEIDETLRQLRTAYNQADRQMKRDILDQWIKERRLGLSEELPDNEWYQQAMEALKEHDKSLRQALEELESDETQPQPTEKRYTAEDLRDLHTRVYYYAANVEDNALSEEAAGLYSRAVELLSRIIKAGQEKNGAKQQKLIGQLEEVVESLEAAAQEQPGEPESAKKGVTLDAADRNMIKDFKQDAERIRRENPEDEEILGVVDSLEALVEDWEAEGGKAKRKELIQAMQSKDWWGILNRRPSRPESAKKGAELSEADRMFIAEFKRNAARVRGENERNSDIQAIVTGLEALVRVWETQGGQARKNAVIDEMRRWKWQRILDGDIPVEESREQSRPEADGPKATVGADEDDIEIRVKRAELRGLAEDFVQFTKDNVGKMKLPSGQPNPYPILVHTRVLAKIDTDYDAARKAFDDLVKGLKDSHKLNWTRS